MSNDMIKNDNISNLTTIYAYMIRKYLSKLGDYSFTIAEFKMSNAEIGKLPMFDHCIVTPPRGCDFSRPYIRLIKQKVRGKMYSLCENNKKVVSEDTLFYMLGKPNPRSIRTYWGCDFELLLPEKEEGMINILMDHQYYGPRNSDIFRRDVSAKYVDSILALKQTRQDVNAVQIGCGRVFPIVPGYKVQRFVQVCGLDFRSMYKEYNKANIFMITHPESFGFSIVESAAAGALIVTPAGYLHPELLKLVHHVIIDPNNIDWNKVFSAININKSVTLARRFSYHNLAEALHKDIESLIK